jgi:fusion and transport protein UGO1
VLDLSPSLGESGANATELVRAVLASALMQYTTTAMIMPFEVGKTLLQVQWVPRDAEDLPEADPEVEEEKLEEVSRIEPA